MISNLPMVPKVGSKVSIALLVSVATDNRQKQRMNTRHPPKSEGATIRTVKPVA